MHLRNLLPALSLLLGVSAYAQQVKDLGQVSMSRWAVPAANYSGITPLGADRYALVSDKEPADGFYVMRIMQDAHSGRVDSIRVEGFRGNAKPVLDKDGMSRRDCEGIAFFPPAGTLFVSGEGDQQILEYALDGQPTGRRLAVPAIFGADRIVANYGFEALAYQAATHRFWTTTESTLKADGPAAGPSAPGAQNLLRLQAFDDSLQPVAQYAYRMDRGRKEKFGKIYALGVPSLLALPDGRLLVLEREVNVTNNYVGSQVVCKLFLVQPDQGWQIDSQTDLRRLDPNCFLIKRLLHTFTTRLSPISLAFANYEGMCLGRRLADGRQTILLVADSQGGYGKVGLQLKDYLRVLVLTD